MLDLSTLTPDAVLAELRGAGLSLAEPALYQALLLGASEAAKCAALDLLQEHGVLRGHLGRVLAAFGPDAPEPVQDLATALRDHAAELGDLPPSIRALREVIAERDDLLVGLVRAFRAGEASPRTLLDALDQRADLAFAADLPPGWGEVWGEAFNKLTAQDGQEVRCA